MVGMMTQNGIIVRKGDSFDIIVQIKDKKQKGLNLEGCNLCMSVKNPETNKVIFKIAGEIISEEEGKVRIAIKPKHTNNSPQDYKTDIQLALKNGDVHTIFPKDINKVGIFRITEDVTEV